MQMYNLICTCVCICTRVCMFAISGILVMYTRMVVPRIFFESQELETTAHRFCMNTIRK